MAFDEWRSPPIKHWLNLLTAFGFEGATLRQPGPSSLWRPSTLFTLPALSFPARRQICPTALYTNVGKQRNFHFSLPKPSLLFSLLRRLVVFDWCGTMLRTSRKKKKRRSNTVAVRVLERVCVRVLGLCWSGSAVFVWCRWLVGCLVGWCDQLLWDETWIKHV